MDILKPLISQHRSVGHKVCAAFIPNFTQFPRKLFGGTFGFIYVNYLTIFFIYYYNFLCKTSCFYYLTTNSQQTPLTVGKMIYATFIIMLIFMVKY
jgi:hypothetical protein